MIKNFRHACVIVRDLERALVFYRDVLGLKVEKILELKGDYPDAVFDKKGVALTYAKMRDPSQPKKGQPIFELHCWEAPKIRPARSYNHVSFTVENLDKEYIRLKRAGVEFVARPLKAPDGKTKVCFGYDPDGNLIEFMEDL